jgi:hypothetical protein
MCQVYNNRQGFDIPQEHIPSDEDMLRYAESDETMVPILIEGLISYIINSVEWFLSHSPTAKPYSEDCRAEALFELTRFTNENLGSKYNPQHFMNTAKLTCLSRVKKWLREMSITVTLPASTSKRNKISLVRKRLSNADMISSSDPVFSEVWFDHFLGMLDNFDKTLVELCMAGHSNRHIGREVDMDHIHVKLHLTRIANLYLDGK